MENLSETCAQGVRITDEMVPVSDRVSLRVVTFHPPHPNDNPSVLFVPGWISMISGSGWADVLREMTKEYTVHYVETREKISSRVRGKVEYSVEALGLDLVAIVSLFKLDSGRYILFGSSLGATVILDCCRFLKQRPLCLVLIGPNAVFRVPILGRVIVRMVYPPLFFVIRPFVKWYLKTFRLDVKSDYAQYQRYCDNLDAADPWKLKKAFFSFSKYQVWNLLGDIGIPTLIIGASKDRLHDPENLKKMVSMLKHASYSDLGTNQSTRSKQSVEEMRKFCATLRIK